MKRLWLPVLFLVAVALLGAACSSSAPGAAPSAPAATPNLVATNPPSAPAQGAVSYPVLTPAPSLDGKALMNERCTVCHDTNRIQTAKKDQAGWEATVARMKGKAGGARLNDAETKTLVEFLTATYK